MSTVEDLYLRIGERIKQAREDRGWTQAQLGEALGYSQATIGNYELGRRHVGVDDLYRIADALNRPYSFFLGVDKQVEEETRRELEQKVRRDMADLVGVRLLPVITRPIPHDAPLDPTDVVTMMPVARELATEADLVYRVAKGDSSAAFNEGDCIFVSRSAVRSAVQVWVLHAAGRVDLYTIGLAREFRAVGDSMVPEQPFTVLGGFCGLYSAVPPSPAQRDSGEDPRPIWSDLDPSDQQQLMQFVEFLRARKGT